MPSGREQRILAMLILIRKKDKSHARPCSMEHHLAALHTLSAPWQQDGAELGAKPMRRVLSRQAVLAQDQSRGMFSEQTRFVPFR